MEEQNKVKRDDKVIPGSYLGPVSEFTCGKGTYTRHKYIYAAITGKVKFSDAKTDAENQKSIISITPAYKSIAVPSKGAISLCRVVNSSHRQAKVLLLSVDGTALREPLHGIVRKEDIRETEKDTAEVFQSFRPCDIVRVRVIGLGESQGYALSTAENELGVVLAHSEHGGRMVPVSWCEMQCTVTGVRERRKVAKVINAVPISQ